MKKKKLIEIGSDDFGFHNIDDRTANLFEKGINNTITKKEEKKLREIIFKKLGI